MLDNCTTRSREVLMLTFSSDDPFNSSCQISSYSLSAHFAPQVRYYR
nr:MAG TPA: hypothetical protein [Caudoviricetes sp.]